MSLFVGEHLTDEGRQLDELLLRQDETWAHGQEEYYEPHVETDASSIPVEAQEALLGIYRQQHTVSATSQAHN